ncbi:hypothetical protein HRI_004348600 [Hibiscus trionum]|uniref:Retrotransposon gag domain-containing protein n=1 Tax=Hibiscus trionum TaxID=183268 RepID=A0A9W7J7N1_HIBTR|nr:hypothetical protein HRI_004348600 [Hibiscus trionum]
MWISLLAKNKLGFIDGTCSRADTAAALRSQWDHCNAPVLSWILNIVSRDLSAGIVFVSSAALVWADLKERFDKIDGSHIYFLYREIASLTQCDNSISVYHTRLRLLWDEYAVLVPLPSCECDESKDIVAHALQQRLFQFLMGLNDSYASVCSQILLMSPLPTVYQAYAMVVQEESQRSLASSLSPVLESFAFYSSGASASVGNRRFNGVCSHCKIRGHKREQCYRLNGFPPDFKFTKQRDCRFYAAFHIADDSALPISSDSLSAVPVSSTLPSSPAPVLTQAQYSQLVELLQRLPSSEPVVNLASAGPLQWADSGDW